MIYALLCVLLSVLAFLEPTLLNGRYVGPAVWAVLVLTVVQGAWRLARAACPADGIAIILLAVGLITQVAASLVVTMLGFAEVLSLPTQLLAVGFLSGAVACVRVPDKTMFVDQRVTIRLPTDPLVVGGAALASLGVSVAVLSHIRYTTMAGDPYHLQMVAEWIRSGSIWPADVIPLVSRGFPGFRESVLAFLSLPLYQVHLALLGAAEFPFFALAVFALCRQVGSSGKVAMAVAAYAVTAPVVARASTLTKNDLSLAISFAVAVFFVSRLAEVRTKAFAILAGLALGALAGTKYTGMFYAVVIVTLAMAQDIAAPKQSALAEVGPGRGMTWALVFAAALLVGGPWYLRNSLAFGNPFYPARAAIAGLTLFNGQEMRELVPYAYTVGWDIGALTKAWSFFVQAFGVLIPLIAVAMLGLGWAMVTGRWSLSKFLGVLCLAPACFVVFLHQPANWPMPSLVQHDYNFNMRYLLPWFIGSLVAGSACLTGMKRAERFVTSLLLAGAIVNLVFWARWWWVLLAMVFVGGAYYWKAHGRDFGRQFTIPMQRIAPLAIFMTVGSIAIGVNEFRSHQQYHPIYGYPADSKGGVGMVLAYAHRMFKGQHVLAYGLGYLGQVFPLYGDDLSNRVVLINEKLSPDRLIEECEARKADYLVVFPPRFEYSGSEEDGIQMTLGTTLMALYPDRFSIAFQSGETYVLKVLPLHRRSPR